MPELLTQAEFAKHRGVSKQAVTKWKRRGDLVLVDGKIDRDATDNWLDSRTVNAGKSANNNRTTACQSSQDPELNKDSLRALFENLELFSVAEAQQIKETYLALQRRLEYERQAGELIRIDDVEREHASRCQRIRSRLLALPDEAAAAIAQRIGGNAGEVRAVLQENVNDVLEELAYGQGGSS